MRQQAQNGVAHAKPHVTKIKLNLKFWLCQKWNFKPVPIPQEFPDHH